MPKASDVKINITAQDKTKAAFNRVNSNLKATSTAIKRIQGAFAIFGAAGITAIDRLGKAALANNRIFVDMAARLGDSAGAISNFALSAKAAGVEVAGSTIALQRQTRRIGEAAQGYGEAQKAIEDLGLSAKELAQLTPTQAFDRISRALLDIDNNAQRVATAFKLWDTEGVSLVQTLEDLQRIRERIKDTGATVTESEAAAFRELREEIAITDAKLLALSQDFVESGIPAALETWKQGFIDLANVIGEVFGGLSELVATVALGDFASISEIISRRWKAMQEAASGVNREMAGVVDATGALNNKSDETKISFDSILASLKEANEVLSLRERGLNDQADIMAEQLRIEKQLKSELSEGQLVALGQEIQLRNEINDQIKANADAIRQKKKDELDAQRALEKAAEETLDKQKQFADDVAANMTSAFSDAVIEGEKLSVVLDGLIKDLAQMVIRMAVLRPLAGGISGAITGFFAGGTDFAPGGLAMVGERGPELVNLPRGSQVIPNHELSGVGGTTINVDARGSTDPIETERSVRRAVEQAIDTMRDMKVRGALPEFA